jgi:hypothetical protein
VICVRKPKGVVRQLDPSDPRNPSHKSHDEHWDELARAIGRFLADQDFERLQRVSLKGTPDGDGEKDRS